MCSTVKIVLNGFFLLSSLQSVAPAKILFLFPHPLPSHYRAFSPIIDGLAAKGHQVTAYIHPMFKKQKSVSNLKEVIVTPQVSLIEDFDFISWRNKSSINYIHVLWNKVSQVTDGALRSPELKALMQSSDRFDLVMVEATFSQESFVAFGHKFNAPVINMHPQIMGPFFSQLTGQPHSFSYIPDFRLPFTDHMTTWQRAKNAFIGVYEMIGGNFYYLPFIQEPMMRKHFQYPGSETLPSLKEQIANVSLHLIDSHQIMSYIRPHSSNVIEIAGTQVKLAGLLPQDLQKFMDEATDGVIYFSFGSFLNVKTFPAYTKQIFVETLKGLKQRVIWKWDEEISGAPNILTRSWLPQVEILSHPNCKLFITHGGFNSLAEVVSIGKPVLGIPFFADQFHNVAFYEHSGIGLEANLDILTVEYLTQKINHIIETPSFAEKAKQLSEIFHDEPQTRLEKAIFWIEYVIRHKGAHHLKPASVTLPYYKYLLLDVIAICVFSIVSITCILFILTRKIFRSLRECIGKPPKLTKNKNKKHD